MVLLAGLLPGLLSTAPALAQQPAAPAAAAKPTTPAAPAAAAKPPVAINPQTAALAEKAIGLAQKDQYEEALKLFRDAYRIDRNPRWLYNVGVL
ncbi:MAG TPA: hypothetical protein PKW11_13345, partial [Pseudomonadota bacterium]|nr:hypothetical protein [Pseudomonadota bacterium]